MPLLNKVNTESKASKSISFNSVLSSKLSCSWPSITEVINEFHFMNKLQKSTRQLNSAGAVYKSQYQVVFYRLNLTKLPLSTLKKHWKKKKQEKLLCICISELLTSRGFLLCLDFMRPPAPFRPALSKLPSQLNNLHTDRIPSKALCKHYKFHLRTFLNNSVEKNRDKHKIQTWKR